MFLLTSDIVIVIEGIPPGWYIWKKKKKVYSSQSDRLHISMNKQWGEKNKTNQHKKKNPRLNSYLYGRIHFYGRFHSFLPKTPEKSVGLKEMSVWSSTWQLKAWRGNDTLKMKWAEIHASIPYGTRQLEKTNRDVYIWGQRHAPCPDFNQFMSDVAGLGFFFKILTWLQGSGIARSNLFQEFWFIMFYYWNCLKYREDFKLNSEHITYWTFYEADNIGED